MGCGGMGIAGRRGAAPIPQLAQGVFPLCPASPAEINFAPPHGNANGKTRDLIYKCIS